MNYVAVLAMGGSQARTHPSRTLGPVAGARNTSVLLPLLPGKEGGARHICLKIRYRDTNPQQVLQLG